MKANKILLILTGGTICSFTTSKGEQAPDVERAKALIVQKFRESDSPYRGEECTQFSVVSPLDILSENMTVLHWNTLIRELRTYDFSLYDGVVILHGTDTLAYTAAMLSVILSGLQIPVILVSSQLALANPNANGTANFKAAVELIVNGIKPNVYVTYRNEEGYGRALTKTMYVHYAAHLLQCAIRSNNFYSCDMTPISTENAVFEGTKSLGEKPLLYDPHFNGLFACVLKIDPYVGLDYSKLSLIGIDAIIHGTYHSSTVETNPNIKEVDCSHYSIIHLKKMCDQHTPPISLFIEPYVKTTYESTGEVLRAGIMPIKDLTSEMAYVKTLIGCSLGYRGVDLQNYLHHNVNNEHLPPHAEADAY